MIFDKRTQTKLYSFITLKLTKIIITIIMENWSTKLN